MLSAVLHIISISTMILNCVHMWFGIQEMSSLNTQLGMLRAHHGDAWQSHWVEPRKHIFED